MKRKNRIIILSSTLILLGGFFYQNSLQERVDPERHSIIKLPHSAVPLLEEDTILKPNTNTQLLAPEVLMEHRSANKVNLASFYAA